MVYRSFLISPASDRRKMIKGFRSAADAVIFDLEDGVAPEAKESARGQLVEVLSELDWSEPHPAVFIRVNAAGSPWFHDDLKAVYHPEVAGYAVPKVESAETLATVDSVLTAAAGAGRPPAYEIVPFIESAAGLWNLPAIVRGQERVRRVVLGGEDLSTDIGVQPAPDNPGLLVPRGLLVLLSRVAGLLPPVDTVYAAYRDLDGLAAEAAVAKQMGFGGKLAIHPDQLEPIHRAFTPTPEEVAKARQVLETFQAALKEGRGVTGLEGSMVEQPIAERARRLVEFAERLGWGHVP